MGDLIASFIHFACDPVTTTDRMYTISTDYPRYTMEVVEQREGRICLFGLGSAGNIVPIQREGKYLRVIGETIGGEGLKVLQWITATDEIKLNVAHQTLALDLGKAVDGQTTEEIDL